MAVAMAMATKHCHNCGTQMPEILHRSETIGAECMDDDKDILISILIKQNEIKDAMLEAYREMTDCLIANFKQLTNSINQGRLK